MSKGKRKKEEEGWRPLALPPGRRFESAWNTEPVAKAAVAGARGRNPSVAHLRGEDGRTWRWCVLVEK